MSIINHLHHTKDGSSMLISQMTDSHLLNMIRLMSENAAKVLDSLSNSQSLPGVLGHSMRNQQERIREELLMKLNLRYDQMAPYVFDAARRGLDISKYLQSATGIVGVVPIPNSSKSLASVVDDEDDERYYDHEEYYDHDPIQYR